MAKGKELSEETFADIQRLGREILEAYKADPDTEAMHMPADSREFKRLKIPLMSLVLGVDIPQRASGGILAKTKPEVYRDVFGSFEELVRAGQRRYHGAALLYALQDSAYEFKAADALVALMAAAPTMPILFQYSGRLASVVPAADYDKVALELAPQMTGKKELLFWLIIHGHLSWSQELSRLMIDRVKANGPDAKWCIWSYGGNCYATAMHPSLIDKARATLKPFVKESLTAKRWDKKLRERLRN